MTAPTKEPRRTADDVLTMGRMGVDIYPLQVGTSLQPGRERDSRPPSAFFNLPPNRVVELGLQIEL